MIARMGVEYTYLINAVSFVAVLLSLVLIGPIAQQVQPVKTQAAARTRIDMQSIREGVAFILSNPIIFATMLIDFLRHLFLLGEHADAHFCHRYLEGGAV